MRLIIVRAFVAHAYNTHTHERQSHTRTHIGIFSTFSRSGKVTRAALAVSHVAHAYNSHTQTAACLGSMGLLGRVSRTVSKMWSPETMVIQIPLSRTCKSGSVSNSDFQVLPTYF